MGPSMFPILQTEEVLLGMFFFLVSPSPLTCSVLSLRLKQCPRYQFCWFKINRIKKKNQPNPSSTIISCRNICARPRGRGVLLIFLLICISGIMLVSSSKWSESPTESYSRFSESHREISFPSIIPWWRARVEPPLCNWKMTLK